MWITLYSVSRDGIGIISWILALFWVAGIVGGGFFLLFSLVTRSARLFLSLWFVFWVVMGGFGLGYGDFYNYAANRYA